MGYLIPIVIVVLFVELILSGSWNRFYFTFGLPLFVRRAQCDNQLLDDALIAALNKEFAGSVGPDIVFNRLGPALCAFREKLFQFTLFTYTPIMHGIIVYDPRTSQASVIGHANWFFVAFVAVFISMSASAGEMLVVIFGVVGVIYFVQARRFRSVSEFLTHFGRDESEVQPR